MSASTMRSNAVHSAIAPTKQDGALKTPSWTDIVAAYHSEGNGDRDMLLALLHAKAKEDERLAALDLLRAEQLRAYTAHLAVHGPLYPTPSPSHKHPQNGQANASRLHHHHSHQGLGLASSAMPSTSSHTRQKDNNNHRQQRHNASSRSPSLSHSTESRLSSPDLLVRTPDEERRLSGLNLGEMDKDANLLPPPNLKRKSPQYITKDEQHSSLYPNPSKRISPDRQILPSISNLLPSSNNSALNIVVDGESKRATSPKSLQHILNQELRPLSLSNYRAQTSDVRSSSSDDDELAEE